jgi:hypothetical protein
MNKKMEQLMRTIEAESKRLGLRIVNGPGPEAKTLQQAQALSLGVRTNGQERAGLILAFAQE